MTISNVRMARVARGLSQLRLAKKVRTSQTAICLIERGEFQPDERLRRRIARALGVSEDVLFEATGTDEVEDQE